jgi:hypothetical protein
MKRFHGLLFWIGKCRPPACWRCLGASKLAAHGIRRLQIQTERPWKRFHVICVAAILLTSAAPAATEPPPAESIFKQFASALGYSPASTIDALKKALTSEWVGKPKQEVQTYIRRVIQNRGKLIAMKNGGRGSRPDLLVLSYRSELLQKITARLQIRFHYDEDMKVLRLECST